MIRLRLIINHSVKIATGCRQNDSDILWGVGFLVMLSLVLYSLPELDGAIDTVPLGGLVGDNIFLVSERVNRLSQRIKKWVHLRRSTPQVSSFKIWVYSSGARV